MKTNPSMNGQQMILAMADNNPGAAECLVQLMCAGGILDIILLDQLEVYGSELYKLWNDCCSRDMDKLKRTIHAFRLHHFSEEEIHENLSQVRAKPFI